MTEFLRKLVIEVLVCLALFGSGAWIGHSVTASNYKQRISNEYITRVESADQQRRTTQAAVDKVSAKYQDDIAGLEGSTDRVIADLRNSNHGLYVKLKATSGKTTGDGRCLVDGKAELNEESSRKLIAVTERGDKWIEALQNTVKALQKEKTSVP